MNRRTFLETLSGASLAYAAGEMARLCRQAAVRPTSLAWAAAGRRTPDVELGQIVLGDGWNPRPSALKRLLLEIDKRTSIEAAAEAAEVRLGRRDLYRWPLLYLSGDRPFLSPGDAELAKLRHHLEAGGVLICDNAEGRLRGPFDEAVRTLSHRLFPNQPMRPVPPDHVVYKSFYLLRGAVGRVQLSGLLEGVEHDGRLAIIYSADDLGGAWARDDTGRYEFSCTPGGEVQREHSYRLGINLVMYALCLDYKSDQVHVPAILERRRRRGGP